MRAVSFAAAYLGILCSAQAALLEVVIQDEKGMPAAARVYLTDSLGEMIFPPGAIRYEKIRPGGVMERHFVPSGGTFSVNVPAGNYQMTIERGKEYLPASETLVATASGTVSRTIRLRRWVDMPKRGWYSGDMHVHRPLSDLPALLDSEDLTTGVPITRWRTTGSVNEDPGLAAALAAADSDGYARAGAQRFFPILNEELESHASALLASGLGRNAVALDYPLGAFGQAVRRAGGISDSEKATSLELPALAALGACDTVGLANNHIWRTDSYSQAWGAWPADMLGKYPSTCEGFVRAGFDMYAALLNSGFPLKLSAGSASGVHPVPPGWSRVYVRTDGPPSPQAWYEGLRKGRSFVTTGPMLLLRVNGRQPGDEIRGAAFPLTAKIEVEVLSLRPVATVEVVVNGVVHVTELDTRAGVPYSYRGALRLSLPTSAWIAARWSAPRGASCDAAHTSPVYVWDGDKPVPPNVTSLTALLARVDKLISRVKGGEAGSDFAIDSEAARLKTIEFLERAREVYRRGLDAARSAH